MKQDDSNIYAARDRAASTSYTLHSLRNAAFPTGVDITQDSVSGQKAADILAGMYVGNVTFKRSVSGMRTTCYLHLYHHSIVKGVANGCGYDTQSAAMLDALTKLEKIADDEEKKGFASGLLSDFDGGVRWKRHLETKGIFAAHIGG